MAYLHQEAICRTLSYSQCRGIVTCDVNNEMKGEHMDSYIQNGCSKTLRLGILHDKTAHNAVLERLVGLI